MSGKLLVNKDFKRRLTIKSNKIKRKMHDIVLHDCFIPVNQRLNIINDYTFKVVKNTSKSKNRCLISGRSKAVYSYFKLTRMMFKKLAVGGYLNGVSKYSW